MSVSSSPGVPSPFSTDSGFDESGFSDEHCNGGAFLPALDGGILNFDDILDIDDFLIEDWKVNTESWLTSILTDERKDSKNCPRDELMEVIDPIKLDHSYHQMDYEANTKTEMEIKGNISPHHHNGSYDIAKSFTETVSAQARALEPKYEKKKSEIISDTITNSRRGCPDKYDRNSDALKCGRRKAPVQISEDIEQQPDREIGPNLSHLQEQASNSRRRMKQTRSTSSCDVEVKGNKNAEMARLNRLRKKRYVENLEREVSSLRTSNQSLACEKTDLQCTVEKLQREVDTLKRTLANETTLASVVKAVATVPGLKFNCNAFQDSFVPSTRSSKRLHSKGQSKPKVRKFSKQSSSTARSSTDAKQSGTGLGGICLHVKNDVVSLALCAACSDSVDDAE